MGARRGDILLDTSDMIGAVFGSRSRFIPFKRGPDLSGVRTDDLLLLNEMLLMAGSYRMCILPLEEVLGRRDASEALKHVALARAGVCAIDLEIPLDMGPIASALSLDRPSVHGRAVHVPWDSVAGFERELLRALLLERNSDHVGSGSYSNDLERASFGSFEGCVRTARSMVRVDDDVGSYHLVRANVFFASSLLRAGRYTEGMDLLKSTLDPPEGRDYPYWAMRARFLLGLNEEEDGKAISQLGSALETARGLGNRIEEGRTIAALAERKCLSRDHREVGGDVFLAEQAREILRGADLMDEDRYAASEARIEASIWLSRSGNGGKALRVLRGVMKDLREDKDEELLTLAYSAVAHAHMSSDDRRKAKRSLMDLILRRPVKQNERAFSLLKEAVSGRSWLREDPETRELFEDEMVYRIDRSAVQDIIARAKEAYPNEFGAMLRGIDHITHIEPVMENARGRATFMFSLFDRLTQRAVPGEGVVHSHPSGSARPSKADLVMFSRFPGINIIIGYPFKEDSMAAYDRLGNPVVLKVV